jgi:hypothetical protein
MTGMGIGRAAVAKAVEDRDTTGRVLTGMRTGDRAAGVRVIPVVGTGGGATDTGMSANRSARKT